MTKIVNIPTISIDVSPHEITQLFLIYNECLQNIDGYHKIVFDFSNCSFFSNHAVVFLGGLDLFIRKKYQIRKIIYNNQREDIRNYFERLGFFHKDKGWTHFHYSDFSIEDIRNKKPYHDINTLLSSDLFPFKSDESKGIIKDTIGELFLNVLQHSGSPAGATASAQYYPSEKIIRFSVIDYGIGIAKHIQNFYEQKHNELVSCEEAILKAFEEGFTTKENASGSGLKTIKDFICMNESEISIFCNNIFYQYDGRNNLEYGVRLKGKSEFSGTFIIIEFNTQKICHSEWRK